MATAVTERVRKWGKMDKMMYQRKERRKQNGKEKKDKYRIKSLQKDKEANFQCGSVILLLLGNFISAVKELESTDDDFTCVWFQTLSFKFTELGKKHMCIST